MLKTDAAPLQTILAKEPSTCGNCAFHNVTADMGVVECAGVPPTPCIVGAQPAGPLGQVHFQLEMMSPRMPRGRRACALWKMGAQLVGAAN